MNSKQIANALIKVFGLTILLSAIPATVTNAASLIASIGSSKNTDGLVLILTLAFGCTIQVVIGMLFINKSWKITKYLFKGEPD